MTDAHDTPPAVASLRGRVAGLSRTPGHPELPAARVELAVEVLDRRIRELVASEPAPSEHQRMRLVASLVGAQRAEA